jgi:hypothetical protein
MNALMTKRIEKALNSNEIKKGVNEKLSERLFKWNFSYITALLISLVITSRSCLTRILSNDLVATG